MPMFEAEHARCSLMNIWMKGNVAGYIQLFCFLMYKVPTMTQDEEILLFMRGLEPGSVSILGYTSKGIWAEWWWWRRRPMRGGYNQKGAKMGRNNKKVEGMGLEIGTRGGQIVRVRNAAHPHGFCPQCNASAKNFVESAFFRVYSAFLSTCSAFFPRSSPDKNLR